MKYIYTLLVCLFLPILSWSQDYSSNWEGLFSYYNIVDVHTSGNRVFAAAKNSVFSYNVASKELNKYSTINGISGENISAIHYSTNYNLLVVGYETGLINVYNYRTGKALQVIDITEKQTVSPNKRRINDFFEIENQLFISTNYGISVYSLSNLEFGDTYFIGDTGSQLEVRQLIINNNTIYAATQGGSVRYASLDNPNLIDFSQWQQTSGAENIKNIIEFNDKIYAVSNANAIAELQNNSLSFVTQFNGNVTNLAVTSTTLLVTYKYKVEAYNNQFNRTLNINSFEFSPNFSSAVLINNQIFIGDQSLGLIYTSINTPNAFNYVSPQGPLLNNAFNMETIPNELWITFGEYSSLLNPYPLNSRGVSHLINDEWINLSVEHLQHARSIVEVTIDPTDHKHVFLSSFIDGLVELQDHQVINFYRESNSNLESFDPGSGDLRIDGTTFDSNNDLWIANSKSDGGLAKLKNNSTTIQVYDISNIISNPPATLGLTKIVGNNSGNLFIGSSEDGVVGFETSTQTFAKVSGGEADGNLPENYIKTLALDNNNQLWIGTVRGLRVLFNPNSMFTDNNVAAQEIIILDEDGVAQELLANVSITDIEVDGNNNKWIATESGAFYLSANGQETIYQFTTANSPIPSNNVNDIEVDDSSGEVYIGTEKGIVVFKGSATASQETFDKVRAFPNPVRPNYSGMVTIDGLMENANVKITDIEGNLVYEEVSQGGSIQWDTRAFGKYKVASGVYMVLITSDDQLQTKVTKIMVIR
ncbi:type IX secretion system anionic LPS delivery protein PorZ [Mesonia aestuariivivens]|uniref:T9SS type A sorting domain-containing protein n=1 Tax=Mesonia aestuariivivens TaxID=2796128 RepID=A0ABS6VYH2_9FLAO|nr:two-component regulator propeller domain-containing protein [Mesonia aestuariivivens]MBW2960302.1 T9SS type A sorting domain-containing protein [Mesonia aestuariivivens]